MVTKITIRTRLFLHQEEAPLHRVSLLGGDFFRHCQHRRHDPHAVMAKLCPGGDVACTPIAYSVKRRNAVPWRAL